MNFFQNKRILVTGGAGFIGSHLTAALKKLEAKVTIPKKYIVDLASAAEAVKNKDMVFHLAAHVGGIHYNNSHPASLLYKNMLPTLHLLEAVKEAKIERTLIVSSACVYPRFCKVPTPESDGFKDEPEPTNYGYGWSKRMAELLAKTYHQEFGLKIAIVRPYNVYGPGDNFDTRQSHVIPGLIKRVCDGESPLIVWGDGSPTRSFVYVDDVVRGMLLALEKYPQPDPINLGTTEEIKIKDLARLIVKLSGKKTKIEFDRTKPNGQPRRNCDTTRAKRLLGWEAKINLKQGLPSVIKYYRDHVQKQD